MSEDKNIAIEAPGPSEPLRVVDAPMPDTPPNGVVLKVHCTGICHSDVHIWSDKFKINDQITMTMKQFNPNFKWPHILGHEVAGEIHSLGENVKDKDLGVGDKVVLYPWVGCADCGPCKHGENNLCPSSVAYDIGIATPGGFQRYLSVLDVKNVEKVSDSVEMAVGCMFGCSALTTFNACQRTKKSIERAMKISGEAKFLIVGAGGLGLWTIQIAKAVFPQNTKIFIADIDEEKLKTAKDQGADEVIYWPRDGEQGELIKKTKEATGGIDGSVDFVGITSTMQRAFQAANKGATLITVGLSGGTADISLVELALKDITLSGMFVGNKEQMKELITLYTEKKIKPPPLTMVKPEEAPDEIQKLKDGKVTGRSIIKFV